MAVPHHVKHGHDVQGPFHHHAGHQAGEEEREGEEEEAVVNILTFQHLQAVVSQDEVSSEMLELISTTKRVADLWFPWENYDPVMQLIKDVVTHASVEREPLDGEED